jgi:hypothetical protein
MTAVTVRRVFMALGFLAGCRATTKRPSFVPFPEAEHAEIGFGFLLKDSSVARITDSLVAYLTADSIPVSRVYRVDGYLETPWFDAKSLRPTKARPLGQDVVRVRAWVDASKPGFAHVEIETVYVPAADPSLRERDTEVAVSPVHPVNRRVAGALKRLNDKYGAADEEKAVIKPAQSGPPIRVAPAVPGAAKAKSDTAVIKLTKPTKPDTTAGR